jgi:molybdopterin molybdotransferase
MQKNQNNSLISVENAEKIILAETRNYGKEKIFIEKALGRILASPFIADRDFPPFDRVTMDGIAIKYTNYLSGNRQFKIQNTQSAGDVNTSLLSDNQCIEVMTGTILPKNTDTVIRYDSQHKC